MPETVLPFFYFIVRRWSQVSPIPAQPYLCYLYFMTAPEDYIDVNKRLWNERTRVHLNSEFYNVEAFLKGKSSLNDIELALLGNVSGKSILHLQCHFGQDTLSLARMGAEVTGVDLSDEAIAAAVRLAKQVAADATFICCNIYELPDHLDRQFDIVFSSYGTIGWLPDLKKWAALIARYLKPGGMFVFAEFHPVVWMFDNSLDYVQYPYFNKEAIVEYEQGTYADKDAPIQLESVGWNHSLDEVLQCLLDEGLQLKKFREYDYSPYNIFPGMVEVSTGRFMVEKIKGMLPLAYALVMEQG